jgi:hypothetical protein
MTTTYNVYRGGTLITSGLTSPTYTDTGLTDGTTYSYQVSATVNGIEGPKSSPVLATPTAVPPIPGGGVIASFPTSGSTVAAFQALVANMNIDTIEIANGTYPWTDCNLNVDRSARPLLVRPAAGATVTFDGTGLGSGDGVFYPGWSGGYGSYMTFAGLVGGVQKFVIQNYNIGQTGLIHSGYISHCEFSGFKVRTCTGAAGGMTSHCLYISSDGTHAADHVTANDWNVQPDVTNRTLTALQLYHPPQVNTFTALRWNASYVHWGFVGRYSATAVDIESWTIDHAVIPFDSQGPAGTVKNMTSTNSDNAPIINSPMVDGGGNSWA